MIGTRYSAIVDGLNNHTYHILGCGAIGSAAATQIVRMGGDNIKLYDYDEVNTENIGVSMYGHKDLGRSKVAALKDMLEDINPAASITAFNEEFLEHDCTDSDIIVLGFDSMNAREYAVRRVLQKKRPYLLIDGRMGAEHYQQYTFKNPTIKQYMATWYSDDEGSEAPCNAKATSYCSNMSGSFICNSIKKVINGEPYQSKFSFNFPNMLLNSEGFNT